MVLSCSLAFSIQRNLEGGESWNNTNMWVWLSTTMEKQEGNEAFRQQKLLCHCNVYPMAHRKPKLTLFNTGEKGNTWSRCIRDTGWFSLCSCCSLTVKAWSQSHDLSKVYTLGEAFHSQFQSCSHIRSQQPCSSSPATSSSFQVLPSVFQALSLNTSQSSSALVYLQILLALLPFQVLPCR